MNDFELTRDTLTPNTLLNDLDWVIDSPPLLQGNKDHCDWTNASFWQQARSSFDTRLIRLKSYPNDLQQLINQQTDYRLGHYFETLLGYWFNTSERYQIITRNLQIRDKKQTVGEVDFIVRDKLTNSTQHWEVACKFYLGIGDTEHIENWYGPMLKDRLVNKYHQMKTQQSQLSEHSAARPILENLSIHIDKKICLMKGRLFYPLGVPNRRAPAAVAKKHLQGWWAKPDSFIQHFQSLHLRWCILNKKQWLATPKLDENRQSYTTDELINVFLEDFNNRPICVVGFSSNAHHVEVKRGFLVPKNWANEINIIDNSAF